MKDEIRVKLVAIARNEAAYIADWVHHHLYFGFDAVHVMINRSTDNTDVILNKINQVYHNVTCEAVDWIDMGNTSVRANLQHISYCRAYQACKDEGIYTHLVFLDVDEFWYSTNFRDSIKSFVQEHYNAKAIILSWLCELGHVEKFSIIRKNFDVVNSQIPKTILKVDSDVKCIRIHVHKFESPDGRVLANGTKFVADDHVEEWIHPDSCYLKDHFILHRMYRSEQEYIASLLRGRPSSGNSLKDNRDGFLSDHTNKVSFEIASEEYEKYKVSYAEFIKTCGIESDLSTGIGEVMSNYEKVTLEAARLRSADENFFNKIFTGTSLI